MSCFGKLRVDPEYIESRSAGESGGEIPEWLQAGRRHAGDAAGPPQGAAGAIRLAWPVKRRQAIIASVLWPSADSKGRWFPFALLAEVPARHVEFKSLPECALALEPVWEGLEAIGVQPGSLCPGKEAPELRGILQAVGEARITYEGAAPGRLELLQEQLRTIPACAFLEKLLGESFRSRFPQVVWTLLRRVDSPGLALRLPSSSGLDAFPSAAPPQGGTLEAVFWLLVLERLCQGSIREMPALAIPAAADNKSGICILFRDFIPQDLPLLMGIPQAAAYMADFCGSKLPSDAAEESGHQDFVRELASALTPDLSVQGFLELPFLQLGHHRNELA